MIARALAGFRARWGLMLGAGLLLGGAPHLLGTSVMLTRPFKETGGDMVIAVGAWLVEGMLNGLLYGLATLALTQAHQTPRLTAGALWGRLLRRSPSVAAASGLTWLITRAGLTLLIVPGLVLAPFLCLAAPAATEPGGPVAAVRRGWILSRGSRWRLAGLLLIMLILRLLVALLFGAIIATRVGDPSLFFGAALLFQVLSDIVAAPIAALLLAAAYVELTSGEDGPANHLAAVFD